MSDRMKRSRRDVLKLSGVALSGLTGSGVASAGKGPGDNGRGNNSSCQSEKQRAENVLERVKKNPKHWKKSSKEEKKLAERLVTVDTLEESSDVPITTASSSKSVHLWWTGTNAFGDVLFKYHLECEWDYDGEAVSSTFYRRWGHTYKSYWDFEGHIDKTTNGGDGEDSWTVFTQGKFKMGFGGVVSDSAEPVLNLTCYADGGWESNN